MIDDVIEAVKSRAAVAEYSATEVTARRATHGPNASARGETRTVAVTVFYDDASGRGDSTVIVQPHQLGDAGALIDRAISRAKQSRGPSWRLPAPAAPARVDLLDAAVADDPAAAALDVWQRIAASLEPGGPLADAASETLRAPNATVDVDVARTEVRTSSGFRGAFEASRIRVALTLSPLGHAAEAGTSTVRLVRRRIEDLALDATLLAAAKRLRRRRRAKHIDAGEYDIALSARAIECAGDGYGWFAPLVAQADGAAARRGLSRYLPGQPIFGDPDAGGDPLTITSDGAVGYAPLSAPFADHGAPVRRFRLVDDSTAAGLALSMREAALADAAPNGGVRNLVVEPGTLRTERKRDAGRPLLVVSDLSYLHTDVQTGDFAAEVALGSIDGDSVTGATLLGNIYSVFAGARLSTDVAQRGWYHGPAEIRFAGVRVV